MKSYRYKTKKDSSFESRVLEDGPPYKDSRGVVYQRYLNGMIRRLTEVSGPVAQSVQP